MQLQLDKPSTLFRGFCKRSPGFQPWAVWPHGWRLSSLGALVTATVVGVGFAAMVGVTIIGIGTLLGAVLWPSGSMWSLSTGRRVEITRDGTPVIRVINAFRSGHISSSEYTDLDGQVLKDVTSASIAPEVNLQCVDYHRKVKNRTLKWVDRVLVFSDGMEPATFWYFIHEANSDGMGYFVGYDTETKSRIGYIGKSGFSEMPIPSRDCFPVRGEARSLKEHLVKKFQNNYSKAKYPQSFFPEEEPTMFLLGNDWTYRIDLKELTVTPVYETAGKEVYSCDFITERNPNDSVTFYNAVMRMDDQLVFLEKDGNPYRKVTIPGKYRKAMSVWFYVLADGSISAVSSEGHVESGFHRDVSQFSHFDENGNVLSSQKVEFPPQVYSPNPFPLYSSSSAALFLANPMLLDGMLVIGALSELILHGKTFKEVLIGLYKQISGEDSWRLFAIMAFVHLYTLLWAFLAWKRETRYGTSPGQRWMWTVFVYLLGLPALIGYLAHRKWPKLEECPGCKASTPVDREGCLTCGTPWAVPERTGIEVIET